MKKIFNLFFSGYYQLATQFI